MFGSLHSGPDREEKRWENGQSVVLTGATHFAHDTRFPGGPRVGTIPRTAAADERYLCRHGHLLLFLGSGRLSLQRTIPPPYWVNFAHNTRLLHELTAGNSKMVGLVTTERFRFHFFLFEG